MKFIAVSIFMLLLLTQTFSKWLMVMDYAINKDFIAKNLCENRNKPKLHCNGKCQLMKKMAAEENQSANNPSGSSIIKIPFSEVWINSVLISIAPISFITKPSYNSFYLVKPSSLYPSEIFHPPLV